MEKSFKLLKFPEQPAGDRFNSILSDVKKIDDEAYFVEALIMVLENHFSGLEGDDAYDITRDIKKLRLVMGEFYDEI